MPQLLQDKLQSALHVATFPKKGNVASYDHNACDGLENWARANDWYEYNGKKV